MKKHGFTLIELIAVMFIMVIAMSLAIAGYNTFKSTSVHSAALQLHATLRLARQHAITKRTTVAFIILNKGFFDTYIGEPGLYDKEARCYAVVDVRQRLYIQSWKELPRNVVFDWSDGNFLEIDSTKSYHVFGEGSFHDRVKEFPFPGTHNTASSEQRNFQGIIFKPNGHIEPVLVNKDMIYYHSICLSEGYMEKEGDKWKPHILREKGTGVKCITYQIEVSYAGAVSISRDFYK